MESVKKFKFAKRRIAKEADFSASVVPWYHPEQFKNVYEDLFSPDITRKRKAVDQISVWETRSFPSLPTAIECSVAIVRAIINDVLYQNGSSMCTEAEVRMVYSMAILRFVSLTIEVHQKDGMSSSCIAEQLDIPVWIVDLRNEVAHQKCPSLSVLRMAAELSLKHLENKYWKIELEKVNSLVTKIENSNEIRSMLSRYQALQYYIVFGKKSTQPTIPALDHKQSLSELHILLRQLSKKAKENRLQFLQVLSSDEYFIPVEEDLKYLMTERGLLGLSEDDDEYNIPSRCKTPELPRVFQLLWSPVLKILNILEAIPELVEILLYTQGSRSIIGQKLITAWSMKLFTIATLGPKFETTALTKIFCRKGLLFNWDRLFYAAIANPCKYTTFMLPLIFSQLDLKRELVRSVMNLVAISQGLALDESFIFSNRSSVFTLEKLKEIRKLQDEKKAKKTKTENLWSLAPETTDFKNMPIGTILSSPLNVDDEMIEREYNFYWDDDDDFVQEEMKAKFIFGNENDDSEESDEGIITVRPNTFEIDEQIIRQRKSFLYKKK